MTNLGFGKKLDQIKPDTSPSGPVHDERLDELAKDHGFVSREPVQKISRKKEAEAPQTSTSARLSRPIIGL